MTKKEKVVVNPIVQSSIPCPSCGSFYRKDGHCTTSTCGRQVAEPKQKGRVIRQPGTQKLGKLWSKNFHRYLTEKEIRSGMKGG